ncbi:MAG: hypothetical protein GX597_08275 [Anaerolineaceae bacterium]|nr:hypothetical protein [Anaerolineaceae bacterium]
MESDGNDREAPQDELSAAEQVARIIESAAKLGVEVDEAAASQWLAAVAASHAAGGDFTVDVQAGVYGHRITLLDFDPEVLARYRRMADIVEIPDRPGVQTAISLSGSAAQSRVQLFPGDADFFERVNLQAATREEACALLGDVLRDKCLADLKGPNYELVEVKWGTWLQDVVRDGEPIRAGKPISWNAAEAAEGAFDVQTPEGEALHVTWEYGCQDPGWCKLDWVIVEPEAGRIVHASNMLDATWESPTGEIVPLDGYLDPYFQEVYLDAESIPLFTRLVKHLSANALQDYVGQLEREVAKYCHCDPRNYGKVAKRLYNIFRLTGRWAEAAFVRELFDEPAALLYQVAALLDTLDEAIAHGGVLAGDDALVDQVDNLVRTVVRVCEGPEEVDLVDALLKLRDDLTGRRALGDERQALLHRSYKRVGELVNHYFQERLFLLPEIVEYVEELAPAEQQASAPC